MQAPCMVSCMYSTVMCTRKISEMYRHGMFGILLIGDIPLIVDDDGGTVFIVRLYPQQPRSPLQR